jgi:hypothetical protein
MYYVYMLTASLQYRLFLYVKNRNLLKIAALRGPKPTLFPGSQGVYFTLKRSYTLIFKLSDLPVQWI